MSDELIPQPEPDVLAKQNAMDIVENFEEYVAGSRPDFMAYFMLDYHDVQHQIFKKELGLRTDPSDPDRVISSCGTSLFVTTHCRYATEAGAQPEPFDITYSTSKGNPYSRLGQTAIDPSA